MKQKTNLLTISKRGMSAPASPIRKLIPFAIDAKKKGRHIYHLNIGDPDFPLPDKVKKSLQKLGKTITRLPYPEFRGQRSLIDAWKKYYSDIQIPYEINDEDLLVTAGASDALLLTAATLTDPEDEILVFEPFFAPYLTYASFISIKLVPVQLNSSNGYHLPNKKEIVKKISPKTKAILFTNPNNPTGTVFAQEEMEIILKIAREYNLFIICDETYRGMVFDNKKNKSMLHVAKKEDLPHIVIGDSLSKRLNVCGARMGVVISKNREFMEAAFRFIQGRPYPSYIEEQIVAPMLTNCLEYIAELTKKYQKRRDVFIDALEQNLKIKIHKPEGAFYIQIKLPIKDTDEFAKWLLTDFHDKNETVMVSPGAGFYATPGLGKDEIRVAYVLNEHDLQRAAELLAQALLEYTKKHK
jgi:aspartate aminotransferase